MNKTMLNALRLRACTTHVFNEGISFLGGMCLLLFSDDQYQAVLQSRKREKRKAPASEEKEQQRPVKSGDIKVDDSKEEGIENSHLSQNRR